MRDNPSLPLGSVDDEDLRKQHADWAERFFANLRHTKGAFHGQPFTLLPWEQKVIRDVYGTLKPDGTRQYRYVYIEIPKKNGKSEIAAGAALYHLIADHEMEGEIYSCGQTATRRPWYSTWPRE